MATTTIVYRCVKCKNLTGLEDVRFHYEGQNDIEQGAVVGAARCLCERCAADLPGLLAEMNGRAVDADDLLPNPDAYTG